MITAPCRSMLAALAAMALLAAPTPMRAQQSSERPTLVVMLTIDQLRPDYLTRFESQLTGGLGRLLQGGAVFLNGYQDHAITETAPGHATTLSGRFPRSTGIVSNSGGVSDPQFPLIGARGEPASPFRFRGTSLVDWLRVRNPASRALSVSRKDRGAILPLGRAKQSVYWYATNGTFTTSTYYADTLPTWVNAFNDRRQPHQWAGKSWDLLLDPSEYVDPDTVPLESGGRDYTFPHAFPRDPAQTAAAFSGFPMMDQLTLSFALEGVRRLRLGAGPATDVLAVSLSTTDAVGHRFGPDSREMHDQLLRLDRYLGAFLDTLYSMRDSGRVVLALTADHGVTPMPEMTTSRYAVPGAGRVNILPVLVPIFAELRSSDVDTSAFGFEDGIFFLNEPALARAGVRSDTVIRAFVTQAAKVRGILRVDRVTTLERDSATVDAARRWYHMLPPDLPAAAVVTLRPNWYWDGVTFTTHGTPHDGDAAVPIIFAGAGIKPGRNATRALVVDIAPTLAAILGIQPLESLDGRVLRDVLRP